MNRPELSGWRRRPGLELVHDPARRRREGMSACCVVTPLRDRPVHAHVGADHPHIAHEPNGRKHPMPAGSRREREGCSFASRQRRHAATRSDTVLPNPPLRRTCVRSRTTGRADCSFDVLPRPTNSTRIAGGRHRDVVGGEGSCRRLERMARSRPSAASTAPLPSAYAEGSFPGASQLGSYIRGSGPS